MHFSTFRLYMSVLLCLLCDSLSLLINLNGTKNGLIVMITSRGQFRNDRMKKKLVSEQATSTEFSVT